MMSLSTSHFMNHGQKWIVKFLISVTTIFIFARAIPAEAAASMSRVGCPNIAVTSVERLSKFFTTVLDFKLVSQEDQSAVARLAPGISAKMKARSAHLTLGDECVDLTEYTSPHGRAFPADSQGNDRWFQHIAIVVSDMDKAYARLREARVQFVSSVPQTLPASNKAAAGISAFYFRDPDGHYLELIHFPPGKGQAKWQNPSDALFLGIDHTAITVSNTAQSLAFYRDQLHLHVAGGSENYGLEQEHLNGVFNAHVLITSLRSEAGIGIELLDYLSPTSGRPIPANQNLNDIASWQIPLEISGPDSDIGNKKLHWEKLPSHPGGDNEVAWIKDPDGHLVKLVYKR